MAFPTGWNRKCKLTIQNALVSGTSHSDFPLLITKDTLPSEIFDSDGSYPAQNGGGDLRFSSDSAGTTQLACEVVNFVTDADPANGVAEIWVKVPTVSGSVDTDIYIWYNTAGTDAQPAVTDTYGRNAVWAAYEAVLHLNSTSWTDSTGNGHDGTATGTITVSSTGHPWGGNWASFDTGVVEYITLGSSADILDNSINGGTVQAVVLPNAAHSGGIVSNRLSTETNNYFVLARRLSGPDGYLYSVDDGTSFPYINYASTISAADWVAMSWTTSALQAFADGAQAGTDQSFSGDGQFASSNPVTIGSYYIHNTTYDYEGYIGEVRIRRDKLLSDWIATEYNNQSSPSTFLVEGTPEAAAAGGVSGTLAFTLDDITASMTGVVEVTGTLSTTLDSITVAASGTFTSSSVTGTLAITLDSITPAFQGVVEVTGSLSATLDSIAVAFSGSVINAVTGTFDITLDGIGFTATGTIGGWVIQTKDDTIWTDQTKSTDIWTLQ